MKSLSLTEELAKVAPRVIWFEAPEQALADPIRFVTYAMTYGTHDDMKIVRHYLSDEELIKEVLDHATPGIFDRRSWAYWNLMLDRYPAPPLPKRHLK